MADYTQLANTLVAPIYDPMEQNLNTQVAEAKNDPYYNSLLSGLETAKNKAFAGIEGRAAARGVAYGNIPSQQQAVYTGEKYLPAVAEVKKTQLDRINALKQTLAELRSKRASSVLDQATTLEERDYQRAQDAAKLAASRASSPSYSYTRGGKTYTTSSNTEYQAASAENLLPQLFDGYNPKTDQWYTENVVIPKLIGSGLSGSAARDKAYAYRKLNFGE